MTPPAAASTLRRGAVARPYPAPARPRRISGPARPARRPVPVAAPAREGLALGLLRALERLSEHPLLDRLIRGRVWIGIVAFALIGIVTLQLGLLKLNSGIGRMLERQASLQRSNSALSIENSELASGMRVEAQAERLGMHIVATSSLKFLSVHPGSDVAKAAGALSTAPHPAATQATESQSSAAEAPKSAEAQAPSESSASSSASAEATSAAGAATAEHAPETSSPPPAAGGESEASSSSAAVGAGGGTQAGG